MTTFVGRRQAVADVKRLLSAARLVTLTGFGGVGKSRLAMHVGRELRRAFPDGACLIELAKLRDPLLVGQAVAAALDVRDRSVRNIESVLLRYLADKRMLLILDNCEHVLDGCGELVTRLLSAAPKVRILATSRESLGISGEHSWRVPPLAFPTETAAGTMAVSRLAGEATGRLPARRHEALMLFEDRAAAVSPGFSVNGDNEATVARLCQRLDGVPLAIELAAVRMRMLSAEQILARLEDRFRLLTDGQHDAQGRHRSLRAAVEWSFDLCTETERLLWARCSVFAGGFDLDAVESVCAGEGLSQEDVFAGVTGLVDKSILSCDHTGRAARYRMLETIRHYGQEQLVASGEEATVRRGHRDYYLRIAEQSDADSCGPRQAEWMARLRAERSNIWAALDYCFTEPGEARVGLRMASALWFYWVACGVVRDGRLWLDRALALDAAPSGERARALWMAGWIASLQGDNTASRRLLRECQGLARQLGDETDLTYASQFLGEAETFVNDLEHAMPLLDDALSRHRQADAWTAPGLLIFGQHARTDFLRGDVDRAVARLTDGLKLCVSLNERWTLSCTEWNLSVTWWAAGNVREAAKYAGDALRKKAELDDQFGIPFCLEVLAWVAASDSHPHRAAVLFGAVRRMWDLIGRPLFGFTTLLEWSAEARQRSQVALGEDAFAAAERIGATVPQQELIAFALSDEADLQVEAGGAPVAVPSTGRDTTAVRIPASRRPAAPAALTRREREVAALVAEGMTNKEIASRLVISRRTAEAHIENILTKFGFNCRAQIAAWAAVNAELA
ncbi:LuxR C-terminal-related transcriptional regulator [Actinopolymorpha sp. B11F2]|uniref:LuxR C-terminal-related transcriptional regulator n=1 Tax=Actinopolymorpha sp. B11F2 TaxID=3160862 RepID=UPI0032E3D372